MLDFQLPNGFLSGDPPSWYAVIRPAELRPARYDGVPRHAAEASESRILILEAGAEGDVFVSEYAEDFGYVTDTWFAAREAAVDDVEQRFGDQLGVWLPVPAEESDPESYVLRTLSSFSA
jgi:hypothetical protein